MIPPQYLLRSQSNSFVSELVLLLAQRSLDPLPFEAWLVLGVVHTYVRKELSDFNSETFPRSNPQFLISKIVKAAEAVNFLD